METEVRREPLEPAWWDGTQKVVVLDFRMPFLSMVWFMVKWAIAAIPAGIIVVLIYLFLSGLLVASFTPRAASHLDPSHPGRVVPLPRR